MTSPSETSLPSWSKLLREGPSIARLLAAQFRRQPINAKPVHTAPVMVLPGFLTGDFHTGLLRRTIKACGGHAFGWGQGLNIGADPDKFVRLLMRIDQLSGELDERLVLVGLSLGGLYARELAKQRPDEIAMVVTLGTPFSHGPGRNNGRPVYNLINDHEADHPPFAEHPEQKPPAFTVACWSGEEGMVAPISAAGEDNESDVRVELHCPHHDMATDPEALRTIVAILRAQRVLSFAPMPLPKAAPAQRPATLDHGARQVAADRRDAPRRRPVALGVAG